MIKEFCLAWEKNKGKLEDYFKKTPQGNYADYEELVKLMFDIVINPYMKHDRNRFDTESIAVIDDSDYQGTCLFLLHQDVYQPLAIMYIHQFHMDHAADAIRFREFMAIAMIFLLRIRLKTT